MQNEKDRLEVIEVRCRYAIENLRLARMMDAEFLNCETYHESLALIGSLPQFVRERDELAGYRTPIEPEVDYNLDIIKCPRCGELSPYSHRFKNPKFCPECGQRWNWE